MSQLKEQRSKRLRARHLIIVKGFSQKEAGKIVGVSEKTVSTWNKKYGWKEDGFKEMNKRGGLTVVMDNFFTYIRSASPDLLESVKKLWTGFLKSEEKSIGET